MEEEELAITSHESFLEVLRVFAKLGVTSFGGPVAHLGYFRQEIVIRRKWVDEAAYADFLSLSQFLPSPSSSQLGIALGMTRAGVWGGLAAWLGFTLPSAILLTLFAYATTLLQGIAQSGWLHGLLIVAVAVVAQAVLKKLLGSICERLDHRMLLPTNNPSLVVVEETSSITVRHGEKTYLFPKEDVVVLPIPNTTAEILASWIGQRLEAALAAYGLTDLTELEIEETVGQRAFWRKQFEASDSRP